MSDAKTELGKLAANLHKAHYTVEDVRAAFVKGCELVTFPMHRDANRPYWKAEALRRWPEEVHDDSK
jgi:hypothetical protein